MMDQTRTTRTCLATALAVLLVSPALRADEPIAAPPAPVIDAAGQIVPPATDVALPGPGLLAPTATDAVSTAGDVLPAGRRDMGGPRGAVGSLAPVTIGGGEPNYIPGLANGPVNATSPQEIILPEGAAMGSYPEAIVYSQGMPVDEATVRISDKPADQVGASPPGIRASSKICPECRYCQHGLPYHQCPQCEPSAQMVRQYVRRHGVILPPDYGWTPPGKHPIDRISIDYYRAFAPGANGVAQRGPAIVRPTVYWPTDTTQLGYTYQHSPRWMPYPGMVPPVPHPAQWHVPFYNGANHYGMNGPCPNCRGNAVDGLYAGNTLPQSQSLTTQPSAQPWTPTDVTQLPAGPALNSSASVPSLSPVPF